MSWNLQKESDIAHSAKGVEATEEFAGAEVGGLDYPFRDFAAG